MTLTIRVVYVKEPSADPPMTDILQAIAGDLGIHIIHGKRHGNSVIVKLPDCDFNEVRRVLNNKFPHKLSIFRDEPGRVYITYVHNASIVPSAVAIASALVEAFDACFAIDGNIPGKDVTLSVPRHIDPKEIEDVLDEAFNHSLHVFGSEPVDTKPEFDTITDAENIFREAAQLMKAKNADYGDSWRRMRLSSITDQILVKVHRIRTIEESDDAPQVSEGVESEYRDILNYCVFAILKLRDG